MIGIAIGKGMIKSVDKRIKGFFPKYEFQGGKAYWTIEHFLTMTTGLEWNEKLPYNHPANDEIRMTFCEDPAGFVLNRSLSAYPGEKFNYNGGATQVLAEIIERTSHISLDRFAKEYLFNPMGILKFEWNKYSTWGGSHKFAAPSGLRLTSRDLMKIGLLYYHGGIWNDKRILDPV